MYYIKKKSHDRTMLQKSYTESEEIQYQHKKKIYMGKFGVGIILASAFLVAAASLTFSWDGAGDKWTCSNCGSSNYNWQSSCSNCGKS